MQNHFAQRSRNITMNITAHGHSRLRKAGDTRGQHETCQHSGMPEGELLLCNHSNSLLIQWYTQEYIKTNGTFNWNTRIANFKFPTCGGTPTPDFSVAASPSSLTIAQGSSGTSTITITSLNGFNAATTLSASGLPTGVTAAFSTNPVTPPANGSATSTLTLTASGTATTGNATVTITGTSGALTHSTTIAPNRDLVRWRWTADRDL